MAKTQILGIVRFSVLSTLKSPFNAYRDRDFDQVAALILDETRLAERFRFFESICLPSLDGQDDRSFMMLIVAPRLLPSHWKDRLAFLATERTYLRIHYAHESEFRISDCSGLALEMIDRRAPFFTFRLDDDDALSCTFISRARSYLNPRLEGHGLSFCKGFYFQVDGADYRISSQIHPNLGAGLGYISSGLEPRTIFDVSELHPGLPKRVPVITDATRDSFLVSAHGFNDSGRALAIDGSNVSLAEAAVMLRERGFSVELELLSHLQKLPPPTGSCLELSRTLRPDPSGPLEKGLTRLRKPTKHEKAARRAGRSMPRRTGYLRRLISRISSK